MEVCWVKKGWEMLQIPNLGAAIGAMSSRIVGWGLGSPGGHKLLGWSDF